MLGNIQNKVGLFLSRVMLVIVLDVYKVVGKWEKQVMVGSFSTADMGLHWR